MRRSTIFSLMSMLLLSSVTRVIHGYEILEVAKTSVSNQLKSYLPPSPQPRYRLFSTVEGTISLVDSITKKVVWAFRSGEPIYSSYQASQYEDGMKTDATELGDDFYMDYGADGYLYNHTIRQGKCIDIRKVNAQEYIGKLPHFLMDRVILGRKDTAAFVIDGKTGRLIKKYRLDGLTYDPSVVDTEDKAIILANEASVLYDSHPVESDLQNLIQIKRNDYMVQCKSISGDVLWSVAFAEIEAEQQCQPGMESFSASSEALFSRNYMGSNEKQLPYKTRAPVIHCNYSYEELLSRLNGVDEGILQLQDHKLPLSLVDEIYVALPDSRGSEALSLPAAETENFGSLKMLNGNVTETDFSSTISEYIARFIQQFYLLIIGLFSICGFGFGFVFQHLKRAGLSNQPYEYKDPVVPTKKKKTRKSGNIKNNIHNGKAPNGNRLGESKFPTLAEGNERESVSNFFQFANGQVDGRRIGKLIVYNKEIGVGSNGTVVLEGIYAGRPVAVKRLVQTHHDVALKEIQNLIASDQHPNIVRWYGVEFDQDFIYLSLERCTCSLNEIISASSESLMSEMSSYNQSPSMDNDKCIDLWKKNGYPSPQLLKLMRDVVAGLSHLHELGIIHRDLKPQNVLIVKDRSLCAKVSDMGISKRLHGDTTSLTGNATGSGSSGWQAPEQLADGRQTRAVDLFSLGCLLFFCMTGGKHPYGESFERDVNIMNDRKDLFLLEGIPEAVDLLSSLLDPNPDKRLKSRDVLQHPLFWNSDTRLSFLRDASDRVELENREAGSQLLASLESVAPTALNGKWDEKLETIFIDNLGRYRRYRYDSVRDLLRVIRNKLNHYRELPSELQELLGSVPDGFEEYFSSRFPKLLIQVYRVFSIHCKDEEFFQKYTKIDLL